MCSHEYKRFEDLFYVLYMTFKVRHQAWLLIFFGDIGLLFMKVCASIAFLRRWALMALYLCFRFCIFNRPSLENDVSQVEGAPLVSIILTWSTKCLPLGLNEMHIFFWEFDNYCVLDLHASLMDIHHNTSIRSMLENKFIFLTSKTYIRFLFGQGGKAMVGC